MDPRPNIVFLMADDHAAHAIGAYGSRINQTPGMDRLAGTYNHVNGVTGNSSKDARQTTYVSLLHDAGYQTFLDYAGVPVPSAVQGRSLRPVLAGNPPADWRTSMYYRYWVNRDVAQHVWAHYGVRTDRYKLVYYYDEPCGAPGASPGRGAPEWELFDLQTDPHEMRSVYADPAYAPVVAELKAHLRRLQTELGDTDCAPTEGASYADS